MPLAGDFILANDINEQVKTGTELLSFTDATFAVVDVAFDAPFAGVPVVSAQIASGSGQTSRWGCRGINVGADTFQIFVFGTDNAGIETSSWTDIPVTWIAVYLP